MTGHHPSPPRRFRLMRIVDETGISGTGIVATGLWWTPMDGARPIPDLRGMGGGV